MFIEMMNGEIQLERSSGRSKVFPVRGEMCKGAAVGTLLLYVDPENESRGGERSVSTEV